MHWFKKNNKTPKHIVKESSAEETIQNALTGLSTPGVNSQSIAIQFVMQMSNKDPEFSQSGWTNTIMKSMGDANALTEAINNYRSSRQQQSPIDPTPSSVPVVQPPTSQPPASLPISQEPNPVVTEAPVEPGMEDQDLEEIVEPTSPQEGEVVDDRPQTSELGLPRDVEEDIDEEENEEEAEEELPVPTEEQQFQSFEDRMQQDYGNMGDKKVTNDPTIMQSFSMPASNVPKVVNYLSKINKKLRDMYYPEIKMEAGDAFDRPVFYEDGPTDESFSPIKISGKFPSPSDEINVRVYEPETHKRGPRKGQPILKKNGKPKMKQSGTEPKGMKILARIDHHPLTDPEIKHYLETEPDGSKLKESIKAAIERQETPSYNTIVPLGAKYKLDDKFYFSSSKNCFKCSAEQSRGSTFICAIVPPDQLVNKMYTDRDGNEQAVTRSQNKHRDNKDVEPEYIDVPAKEIRAEDVAGARQEQLGSTCADPYDEFKVMASLEREISKWKKTDQENAEYDVRNPKKQKKPKGVSRVGGTRGIMPSDKFFETVISMMRRRPGDELGPRSVSRETNNWLTIATLEKNIDTINKRVQNGEQAGGYRLGGLKRRLEQAKRNANQIAPEDSKVAKDAVEWWRGRMGSMGMDYIDKNKVSLSILPTINTSQGRKEDRVGIQSAIEMMKTYLEKNNITLEPLAEEPLAEEPRLEEQGNVATEAIEPDAVDPMAPDMTDSIDDIATVQDGSAFVSRLKFIQTKGPYRKRGGETSYGNWFEDSNNKRYVAWTTEPFEAEENSDVNVRGTKGDYSRQYRTTTLQDLTKVAPERLDEHQGTEFPEPPVEEAVAEPTPRVEEPVVPETPVADPVVEEDQGMGAPAMEEEAPLEPEKTQLQTITERVMNVIDTGRDSKNNILSIDELIPIYTGFLKKIYPNLREEEYSDNLRVTHQKSGRQGLKRYVSSIERYLESQPSGL